MRATEVGALPNASFLGFTGNREAEHVPHRGRGTWSTRLDLVSHPGHRRRHVFGEDDPDLGPWEVVLGSCDLETAGDDEGVILERGCPFRLIVVELKFDVSCHNDIVAAWWDIATHCEDYATGT